MKPVGTVDLLEFVALGPVVHVRDSLAQVLVLATEGDVVAGTVQLRHFYRHTVLLKDLLDSTSPLADDVLVFSL